MAARAVIPTVGTLVGVGVVLCLLAAVTPPRGGGEVGGSLWGLDARVIQARGGDAPERSTHRTLLSVEDGGSATAAEFAPGGVPLPKEEVLAGSSRTALDRATALMAQWRTAVGYNITSAKMAPPWRNFDFTWSNTHHAILAKNVVHFWKLREKWGVNRVDSQGIGVAYAINVEARSDRLDSLLKVTEEIEMKLERIDRPDPNQDMAVKEMCHRATNQEEIPVSHAGHGDSAQQRSCREMAAIKIAHVRALKRGIQSGAEAFAIFEDDFVLSSFADGNKVLALVEEIQRNLPAWDVIMLSANVVASSPVQGSNVTLKNGLFGTVEQVHSARQTGGMVVRNTYAKMLLESHHQCDVVQGKSIDVCWQILQSKSRWYVSLPQVGQNGVQGTGPGARMNARARQDFTRCRSRNFQKRWLAGFGQGDGKPEKCQFERAGGQQRPAPGIASAKTTRTSVAMSRIRHAGGGGVR